MRDLVIAIVAAIVIWFALGSTAYYTTDGVIREVENGVVTVEDRAGHLWDFEGFGYHKGDNVTIKFYDNGTDTERIDDKIVDVFVKED